MLCTGRSQTHDDIDSVNVSTEKEDMRRYWTGWIRHVNAEIYFAVFAAVVAWGQKSISQPHKPLRCSNKMLVCIVHCTLDVRANLSIGFGTFGGHS